MKRMVILITVLILCLVPVHRNIALGGEILTMDVAVEAALSANPEIAAVNAEYEAAKARPPQAATPPDPEFMVDFIGAPMNTADVGKGTIQYMVEQKIPFPSKLVLGHKAEKKQADAMRSGAMVTAQEIKRQTEHAYIDLWRFGEEERINKEALSAYLMGKGSAETAYASAKGGMEDPVRASVELGDIEGQLAMVEQDRLVALANLSKFMAKPLDPSIKTETPHIPHSIEKLETLIERAKESRPEIIEAASLVEAQGARRTLAKAQYAPDFTFRLGYMDNPSDMPNGWYGRAGISVPLWSLSKQRFGVREAEALFKRAQSMKEGAELSTESDIRSTYARLLGAKKVIDVYANRVVPRARVLVSSSRQAYSSEKSSFLGVVESVRSLNNAQLALVRAKAEEAKAYADIERAVGELPTGDSYEQ